MRDLNAILMGIVLLAVVSPAAAQKPKLYTAKESYEDGSPKRAYSYYKRSNNYRVKHGYELHYYPSGKKRRKMVFSKGQFHGDVASWFENGQPDMQGKFVRGKKTGTWKAWYMDGSPRYEMNYQDGDLHGIYKTWYPDKKPRVEVAYSAGKRHGAYVEWYESGTRSREITYVDGQRDGKAVIYYSNSRRQTEFTYAAGVLDGQTRRWDEAGSIVADGVFKDGKPVSGTLWEPGDQENQHFVSGYQDGVIVDQILYEDGKPKIGIVTEWHVSGGKWRECHYFDGRKHGAEKWWFPSGKPHSKCAWKANKLNGTYVEYFESGPKKLEVELANGLKHGRERTYDAQRGVLADGMYRDGKPWSGTLAIQGTQLVTMFKDGGQFETTEPITVIQEYVEGVPQKLTKNNARPAPFTLPGNIKRPSRADAGLDVPDAEEPSPFKKIDLPLRLEAID
jgi:antitoxin component YwqK of YwqJK toxin-antitoxin module